MQKPVPPKLNCRSPLERDAACARVCLFPFAMSAESSPPTSADIQVPMSRVVKFVRQVAHDLRNHLNAAELQAAYLSEIADEPEMKEEIKRLRTMISELGANLQSLTVALSQPRLTLMPYPANEFAEDLRRKLEADHPDESKNLEWDVELGDAVLQIDPQLLMPALLELFSNSFRHERGEGSIRASAQIEEDQFVFTLREPKRSFERSTDDWGREPLKTVGQGHYGLGLHRARAIVEAHQGTLNARYDNAASHLVTIVSLPLGYPDKQ